MSGKWKPGTGQKIERLYAWVATEPDGGEGILGAVVGGVMMPLIGADTDRVESFREHAKRIAEQSGCPVQLRVYTTHEVLEDISKPH